MNFLLGTLIFTLVLQNCAKGVHPNRPRQEFSNAESNELRPKDGYFTVINHGSTSAAELERESCDTGFVNSGQRGVSNSFQLPETGAGEKQQSIGSADSASNSGASTDVVVTVEEKPIDQAKERLVVVGQNTEAGKNSMDVPAYVIVRGPKLDQDSRTKDQMVTISLDTLNSLIKGSLFPPSGPSMDSNLYVASLPDQETYGDAAAAGGQMLVLNVVPDGQDALNVEDALPGFQEAADGTYRIKD